MMWPLYCSTRRRSAAGPPPVYRRSAAGPHAIRAGAAPVPHRCRTGAAPVPHRFRRRSAANPNGYLQTARQAKNKPGVFFRLFWCFCALGGIFVFFGGCFCPKTPRRTSPGVPHAIRTVLRTCFALAPHLLRTCFALVPHLCRTCAALVPHLCRTCAALVPHLCRTCAALWADLRRGALWGCVGTRDRTTKPSRAGAAQAGLRRIPQFPPKEVSVKESYSKKKRTKPRPGVC